MYWAYQYRRSILLMGHAETLKQLEFQAGEKTSVPRTPQDKRSAFVREKKKTSWSSAIVRKSAAFCPFSAGVVLLMR